MTPFGKPLLPLPIMEKEPPAAKVPPLAMLPESRAPVEKLTLEVYPTNEEAVALYRKFGFVEEGRLLRQSRKSYGYEDELIMSKVIP